MQRSQLEYNFSLNSKVKVELMSLIEKYNYNMNSKLKNFEKFVDRQSISRFLVRYELFKKTIHVKGSIVECGVHYGGGIMAWAKLSSSLEPFAIHRKVIGFDTFNGFPSLTKEDKTSKENNQLTEGGFKSHDLIYKELQESICEYDKNRFLNQFNKIELIKGDANITIPKYVKENKHLIVSLLFLDFDLYQPTKTALENFIKRMPKGAILAFDEINNEYWSGETLALLEHFKTLNKLELKKFEFDPNITYMVI